MELTGVSLGLVVGAIPTFAMLVASYALATYHVSPLVEAAFQSFAGMWGGWSNISIALFWFVRVSMFFSGGLILGAGMKYVLYINYWYVGHVWIELGLTYSCWRVSASYGYQCMGLI